MSLSNAAWLACGLFLGGWGCYAVLQIRGRFVQRNRAKTEFVPRERPRKSSQFKQNSEHGARQSKARIIGPK